MNNTPMGGSQTTRRRTPVPPIDVISNKFKKKSYTKEVEALPTIFEPDVNITLKTTKEKSKNFHKNYVVMNNNKLER